MLAPHPDDVAARLTDLQQQFIGKPARVPTA